MEPKSYPPTDSAEQDSKTVLESLTDSQFVKLYIETRSTRPNIDGTIELVNENRVPIGRLDVQLRSIPKGQTSFSCETSLAGYSKVSNSPVLLICVDSANKCAYWKHINPYMPELKDKETQKSFMIHFSKASDSIDRTGIYRHKWMEIARDYQKRIEQYPIVRSELTKKLGLEAVEPAERELFQRFIDTINNLLDNDFIVVKELIFPSIWKLGVGIISSDQHHIQYQIYRIPYKEPSPLVCKLNRGFLFTDRWSPNAITETTTSRESLIDPIKAGRDFVLDRVRKVVEAKALPIYGQHLSADILFSFVDLYHPALGISPELDRYSVQELSYALNNHLTKMVATIVGKGTPIGSSGFTVDIDWLSHYLKTNKIAPTNLGGATFYFSIGSDNFPIRAAFDSLKYLIATGITEIKRSFGRRDLPFGPGKNWIWSGYSSQNEINSVTRVLEHSIEGYTAFVDGNHLKLPSSPYLDPNTAIIYEYEPVGTTTFEGPGLREHLIDNKLHKLPKLSVFTRDREQHHVDTSKFPDVEVEGNIYQSPSSASMVASFFFNRTPFLNLIYKMLSRDLSQRYGMTLIHV